VSRTLDAPFGAKTTYRVGGSAAVLVEVEHAEDFAEAVAAAEGRPIYVLGRGSNTLVADGGFRGVVVHLGEAFGEVSIDATAGTVTAGGAADLPVVARRTVEAGLTGFEWAVGVPGSVGGAVRMNAGGHGSDMAASLVSAEVVDLRTGQATSMSAEELRFGYRSSAISAHHLVVSATLSLGQGDVERGREVLREIVRWRRANQPGGANCGSVFANPAGDSAGRLIEAAGLKGRRLGTAQVSPKHANFIQADAGGSGDDVAALMAEVARTVAEASGVELVSEVRRVGFEGP
jgi:UDP-N-acetylmuramate dehydrogenase